MRMIRFFRNWRQGRIWPVAVPAPGVARGSTWRAGRSMLSACPMASPRAAPAGAAIFFYSTGPSAMMARGCSRYQRCDLASGPGVEQPLRDRRPHPVEQSNRLSGSWAICSSRFDASSIASLRAYSTGGLSRQRPAGRPVQPDCRLAPEQRPQQSHPCVTGGQARLKALARTGARCLPSRLARGWSATA